VSFGAGGALEITLSGRGPANLLDERDPLAGMDLALDIAARDTSSFNPILSAEFPSLGPLIATGRIIRDVEATRIVDTKISLVGNERLSLSATGSIDAFDNGQQNIDLDVEFSTESLARLAESSDIYLADLGKAAGRYRVRGDPRSLSLSDIAIDVKTDNGPKLHFTGAVGSIQPAAAAPLTDIDLVVSAEGSNTKWLSGLVGRPAPDLGRYAGQAKLTGTSDVLTLDALDITAISADGLSLRIRGGIENLHVTTDFQPENVNLRVDASASSTVALTRILGRPDVDLGEFKAGAELNYIGGTIGLEGFEITIGTSDDPLVAVRGRAENLFTPTKLEVMADVDIAFAKLLALGLGRPFPEIGRLKGKVTMLFVSDDRNILRLADQEYHIVDGKLQEQAPQDSKAFSVLPFREFMV